MPMFLDELAEHVRTLNQDLLALEKETQPEERARRVQSLFRTAYSLKGAAGSVNVTLIAGACHRLETILTVVRDGAPFTPGLAALLFSVADAIEEAGMRLREQHDLTGAPLAALLPRLEAVAAGEMPPAPPPVEQPTERE